MAKRNGRSRPKDVNQLAQELVRLSTEESEPAVSLPSREQLSALMSQLGSKGGKIGGERRLETMSAKERKQAASAAARARWDKRKGKASQT